jgi:ribosomal-protein-alanine N-acetyltransferase
MTLQTSRLILRPLNLADAEAAFSGWTGDADVAKYVSWLPHHSMEETIEWLKEISWNQYDDGAFVQNNNYIWGFV